MYRFPTERAGNCLKGDSIFIYTDKRLISYEFWNSKPINDNKYKGWEKFRLKY